MLKSCHQIRSPGVSSSTCQEVRSEWYHQASSSPLPSPPSFVFSPIWHLKEHPKFFQMQFKTVQTCLKEVEKNAVENNFKPYFRILPIMLMLSLMVLTLAGLHDLCTSPDLHLTLALSLVLYHWWNQFSYSCLFIYLISNYLAEPLPFTLGPSQSYNLSMSPEHSARCPHVFHDHLRYLPSHDIPPAAQIQHFQD